MRFDRWEPIYEEILSDLGFDRFEDEMCVRLLKAVTLNSDLISDDELGERISKTVTVIGNAPCLESDISHDPPEGTVIASGSSVGRLRSLGIRPDIVVTDLDGEIQPQLECSAEGATTVIHAHGDNSELVSTYAGSFEGPVVISTQSVPENTVYNFGGFTDGDRAVCIANHFGAVRILLLGFDFTDPMPKEGSSPEIKLRKLSWAKRIIESLDDDAIVHPDRR